MLKRLFLISSILCLISTNVFSRSLTQSQVIEHASTLSQQWIMKDSRLLYVDTKAQKMYVLVNQKVQYVYSISSSKYGVGNTSGSLKTPTGMHQIVEAYGDEAPLGTIFKARINTGKRYSFKTSTPNDKKDHVLTRILRLKGLERGVNRGKGMDSYSRCIYLHGTNNESKIGTPTSRGCIRMRNLDIIDLYNYVKIGDYVYIRG